MSVTELLGIEDDKALRELAVARWGSWLEVVPALAAVPEPHRLLEWRVTALPEVANVALVGLAQLSAVDGHDDRDAALVLAWLVLPAALRVRRELGWIPGPLDESLAAALWVEVRTVPWRRPVRVAARILWRLRDAVRADLNVPIRGNVPDLPVEVLPEPNVPPVPDEPSGELESVLDWALESEVITGTDRGLLDCVLSAIRDMDAAGASPRANTVAGLAGDRVAGIVAAQLGIHPRSVRRRTARVLAALQTNAPRYLNEVAA